MGDLFRLPEKTADLILEDTEYAGARITVRTSPVPLAVYRKAATLDLSGNDVFAAIDEAVELFVEYGLIEWNLADRHGPIPADAKGMAQLDLLIIAGMIAAWVRAITEVPAPLGKPSGGTATPGRKRAKSGQPTSPSR